MHNRTGHLCDYSTSRQYEVGSHINYWLPGSRIEVMPLISKSDCLWDVSSYRNYIIYPWWCRRMVLCVFIQNKYFGDINSHGLTWRRHKLCVFHVHLKLSADFPNKMMRWVSIDHVEFTVSCSVCMIRSADNQGNLWHGGYIHETQSWRPAHVFAPVAACHPKGLMHLCSSKNENQNQVSPPPTEP